MRSSLAVIVSLLLSACAVTPSSAPAVNAPSPSLTRSFEAELVGSEAALAGPEFAAYDAVRAWPTESGRIAIFAWAPERNGCRASFTLFVDALPSARAALSLGPPGEQAQLHYVERCSEAERSWKAAAGTVTIDHADRGMFSLRIERAAMQAPGNPDWGNFVANASASQVSL